MGTYTTFHLILVAVKGNFDFETRKIDVFLGNFKKERGDFYFFILFVNFEVIFQECSAKFLLKNFNKKANAGGFPKTSLKKIFFAVINIKVT